jgi:uncharacterized membrane protein YtjA (UPF0391 family)
LRPDFVPSTAAFFTNFAPAASRNICSEAGLFLQPARDDFERADIEADSLSEDVTMLSWVVTFLIIALIAGILGFGGVAGASIEIAKIIFFIAVVLFLVSAVVGLARGRGRV